MRLSFRMGRVFEEFFVEGDRDTLTTMRPFDPASLEVTLNGTVLPIEGVTAISATRFQVADGVFDGDTIRLQYILATVPPGDD